MKILCIGELLIDFVCTDTGLPLSGGINFMKKPGGAPANVAACVAKLGGNSCFVGAVGLDAFGQHLIQVLQDYQVDTSQIKQVAQNTTLAFVSLMEQGHRDFEFFRGADEYLQLNDTELSECLHASIVHMGSSTALLGGPLHDTYHKLLEVARDNNKLISFDPNYRQDLWGKNQTQFVEHCMTFIRQADLLKVSDEELALLSGEEILEAGCKALHNVGSKVIMVTLGDKGCMVSDSRGCRYFSPCPIEPVDTTGAGDAFVGAVLFKLSQQPNALEALANIDEYVQFANKVSAKVCCALGAMTALPALADIE